MVLLHERVMLQRVISVSSDGYVGVRGSAGHLTNFAICAYVGNRC